MVQWIGCGCAVMRLTIGCLWSGEALSIARAGPASAAARGGREENGSSGYSCKPARTDRHDPLPSRRRLNADDRFVSACVHLGADCGAARVVDSWAMVL